MKLKNIILKIFILTLCFFLFSCSYKSQISHIDDDILNDSEDEKSHKTASDTILKLQEILKNSKKKEIYPDLLLLLSIISCYNDSGDIVSSVPLNYLNQLINVYPDTYYGMAGSNLKRLILQNRKYYKEVKNLRSLLSDTKKSNSDKLEKIIKEVESLREENAALKTGNKFLKDNIEKSREIEIEIERKKQDIIVE